jgi:hypothetical protein
MFELNGINKERTVLRLCLSTTQANKIIAYIERPYSTEFYSRTNFVHNTEPDLVSQIMTCLTILSNEKRRK